MELIHCTQNHFEVISFICRHTQCLIIHGFQSQCTIYQSISLQVMFSFTNWHNYIPWSLLCSSSCPTHPLPCTVPTLQKKAVAAAAGPAGGDTDDLQARLDSLRRDDDWRKLKTSVCVLPYQHNAIISFCLCVRSFFFLFFFLFLNTNETELSCDLFMCCSHQYWKKCSFK